MARRVGKNSGAEYEHIRKVLIRVFRNRGFADAEDLTDAVIERASSKIHEIEKDYTGEKIHYFLGVAQFIRREAVKKKETQIGKLDATRREFQTFIDSDINEQYSSREKQCLKECFFKLKRDKQTLIFDYYDTFTEEKKGRHSSLASERSINTGALRDKIYRIKLELSDCAGKCLRKK